MLFFLIFCAAKTLQVNIRGAWAYGKEKIRGAERNLPDFIGLCPRCQKKISWKTFQNCCRRGGSDYEKFLLDSIFPTKLTEFPTKLIEFVPFIFIISQYCPTVKRILPDEPKPGPFKLAIQSRNENRFEINKRSFEWTSVLSLESN
jgi:hypothetical protein